MSIFHWSPIKKNIKDFDKRTEFSKTPNVFVPRNYVRQRKRRLYNNLLVLLGGLWALTVSHNMDTSDTEARVKLKNILGTSGLFVSHLVAVPLIIWKLNLHYSIVLGAMGMSVTPFFYYVKNPIVFSVVICLRIIFVALFDVSAMIYIVRLARICSKIEGNALFNEILISRSFTAIFGCTANIVSSAWHQFIEESETKENVGACGSNYCSRKLLRRSRLASTLSAGQNTIFIAITIVVALSGIILIAMYLKPLASLGDSDLSDEPQISNPYRVLKQITRPKAKQLAILAMSCIFMHGFTEDFVRAYVDCSLSRNYSFFITCVKEFSIMFAAISCLTIVDFAGFYWLYGLALFFQVLTFLSLLLWNSSLINTQFSYLIVYHVLCASFSVETSILQLLLIQTLGDEEVSSWCFYYALIDVVYVIRMIPESFICIGMELWIVIAISLIATIAMVTYSYGFNDNSKKVHLNERCSLVIKTPKRTLAKIPVYNLNIIVEKPEDIQKIETFLERKYTLATRFLVPPSDDVIFPEALLSVEDVDEDFY